jgi:hypothetical protein
MTGRARRGAVGARGAFERPHCGGTARCGQTGERQRSQVVRLPGMRLGDLRGGGGLLRRGASVLEAGLVVRPFGVESRERAPDRQCVVPTRADGLRSCDP